MIYKSFWRKKTTKKYLFIFILLFTAVFTLKISKNTYIKKENNYHRRSIIVVENINKKSLEHIDNIKSITKAKYANWYDYWDFDVLLIENSYIDDNSAIISEDLKNKYMIGDYINITYEHNDYKLKIVDFSDNISKTSIEISLSTMKEMEKEKHNDVYLLNLKNWMKIDDTTKKIPNSAELKIGTDNSQEQDYKDVFKVLCLFMILLIFIFLIVGVITILNIIRDEKSNNNLYKMIGYHNSKIMVINIIKLMNIIFFALIIGAGLAKIIERVLFC